MKTILETYFEQMLCCPLCKTSLEHRPKAYLCYDCGTAFPRRGGIPDFRVMGPDCARSVAQSRWTEGQEEYEQFAANIAGQDSYEVYLAEIDSAVDIY